MGTVHPLATAPSDEARFFEFLVARGLSRKTIAQYMRSFRRADQWCRLHGWDLATAPASVIAEYTLTTPASTGVRRHLRTALVRYWSMIERPNPPYGAVRVPPKSRGFCHAITEEEAALLEEVAWAHPGREGTAVLSGLYLGLRVAEIASMHWQRFDHDLGWYTCQGKGDRTRNLPVADPLRDRLSTHPGRVGWLFTGSKSRAHIHVHPATVWEWVREMAVAAGLPPLRTHQLRHTAIATIHDNTGDLAIAQKFAGHASPETTRIYTRVPNEKLTAAVATLNYRRSVSGV